MRREWTLGMAKGVMRAYTVKTRRCAFIFPANGGRCCGVARIGCRYCKSHDRGQP